ncbi:MAG: hypothetical protein KJ821_01595 [Actinobacteria bacterium]|nr:hypothetical protein [Actinomycetota bacterium]MCG2790365.1 hypothetical protein [Actinomycetes bacterium]
MNRKYMDLNLKNTTSHLAKLTSKGKFLRGNPVIMRRVCGNSNCRCILEGKKHKSLYISKNKDGKRKMIYIPKRMEEEVVAKLGAYQKIKKLTERISELNYAELKIKKDKGDV